MRTVMWLCGAGVAVAMLLIAVFYRDAFAEIFLAPAFRAGAALYAVVIAILLRSGLRRPPWRVASSTASLGVTCLLLAWAVNVIAGMMGLYRLEGAVAYACEVDSRATADAVFRLTSVKIPADVVFECRGDHRHTIAARPPTGAAFFAFATWSYEHDLGRFILTD